MIFTNLFSHLHSRLFIARAKSNAAPQASRFNKRLAAALISGSLVLVAAPFAQAQNGKVSVNIIDYGAVGDGLTYNDAAIAKALASGSTLIIVPQGQYRIRNPINVTNRTSGSLTIRGSGRSDGAFVGSGIIADTGACIIDATGTQFLSIEDITLMSGFSSPATCGVNYARSLTSGYAQFDTLKNVSVLLSTNPGANNGYGSVGIYNYGAEIFNAHSVYVRADQPMAVLNDNLYGITSNYTSTISGQTSMSVVDITGSSTLWAFNGPALRLYNTFNIHTTGLYINASAQNSYPFAIEMRGSTSFTSLKFNVENFKQLLTYTGTQENLQLQAAFNTSNNGGRSYIVANGSTSACSTLQNSSISVSSLGTATHYLIDYTGSNVCGIRSSDFYLSSQEGINMPVGNFSGMIHAYDKNPVLNLPGVGYAAYVLVTGQGVIQIGGTLQASNGAPLNVGSSSSPAASISSNVLSAVNGSSACRIISGKGNPNYSVSGSPCDLYMNSDGGVTNTLWVKQSGAATNYGWVAK